MKARRTAPCQRLQLSRGSLVQWLASAVHKLQVGEFGTRARSNRRIMPPWPSVTPTKPVPCAEGMVNASRIQKKVAPGKGGVLAASRSRLGQVIQLQTVPAAVGGRTSSAQASLYTVIVDCT